jgi:hypothetical protein
MQIKKRVKIFLSLFLSFVFFTSFIVSPVLATRNYGEGYYGEGKHGGTEIDLTPAGPPTCNDPVPGTTPVWLYLAVPKSQSSVELSFTEGQEPYDKYVLEYGTSSGKYQYAVTDMGDKEITKYLVNGLSSNKTYYFRIRTGNGCATGLWSNEISAKTKSYLGTDKLEIVSFEIKPQPKLEDEKAEEEEEKRVIGYKIRINVKDISEKPVSGAKVTLYSSIQEKITNKDGVVEFENIEPGNHKIVVDYKGYRGEQSINLAGDVKEFTITVQIQPRSGFSDPIIKLIIGFLILIILIFLFLFLRLKINKQSKLSK